MKNLIFILTLILFSGCDENNDPKVYTSIEGKWKYTTPAEDMKVEFEIYRINGEYKIKKASIIVNDQKLNVKIEDDNIEMSTTDGIIQFISLTAENNVGIGILFQSAARNESYTELLASDVDYYPSPGELVRIEYQTITR